MLKICCRLAALASCTHNFAFGLQLGPQAPSALAQLRITHDGSLSRQSKKSELKNYDVEDLLAAAEEAKKKRWFNVERELRGIAKEVEKKMREQQV
jgi:hypothetical protein